MQQQTYQSQLQRLANIQFQTIEKLYDPVLYSIAVVQSDVFNAFGLTTDPSSASSLWNDSSIKQEKEWVYKLWYFIIKMYDLKNLVCFKCDFV
jgi:hypothetical protein